MLFGWRGGHGLCVGLGLSLCLGLCAALACGLEHNDGSGRGYVQRRDGPGHGDAQQVVAGAADEVVQAVAFASEDDDGVGREVVLVVAGCAALVEADAPDVVLFELFQGADEVDDAGDADMLGGSGGGFDGDGAEGCGAALGDEDAVDAGCVGGTEERAEVLRVFDAVECEEQARGWIGIRAREQVFEVEEFAGADDGDDALMGGGVGEAGELFFGLEAETDAVLAAGVDDALEALVVTVTGDADVVEAAIA